VTIKGDEGWEIKRKDAVETLTINIYVSYTPWLELKLSFVYSREEAYRVKKFKPSNTADACSFKNAVRFTTDSIHSQPQQVGGSNALSNVWAAWPEGDIALEGSTLFRCW
jgi:hypothetical protein